MPPPSQLAIATSALTRLTKEKASYHKEHAHQEANIAKLESAAATSEDENAEYTLRQERKALSETAAMFPQLRIKIEEAKAKLEAILSQDAQSSPEDVDKAKEAIAAADGAIREAS